ncbi:stage IV sporulation protein A [Eubacterium sp. AF22-9]|uniref:stage IV sporulation protein A n=1 Tax=Eubacterium sp. AF22-9 TaxID=2292233 RepID=UPI0024E2531D|nr:stage IV sporulation protein A [Eubacterium sp. AF22-9]
MIKSLSDKKNELGSFGDAISEVNLNGFGVVTPSKENIQLDEPVVIKNGNKYGVKIKAKVPSINMELR